MMRVELGSRWLAASDTGTGDPVVLVHSGGFTSRQWRKLAEALAPTQRVVAPDLTGYGASSPLAPGEPFEYREDVAALAGLIAELPPAHVVGHSYGGLLALQLALARPEAVRSLALYEPVAFGILDAPEDADARANLELDVAEYTGEPWLAAFVDWWNGSGAWAHLAPEARDGFLRVGWKVYREVASLIADRTDRATYATIAVPTLLLGGERTPLAERRVLDKLARALPAARLERFADMGHMGPITHAAIVNAAIAAHVRAASPDATRSTPPSRG